MMRQEDLALRAVDLVRVARDEVGATTARKTVRRDSQKKNFDLEVTFVGIRVAHFGKLCTNKVKFFTELECVRSLLSHCDVALGGDFSFVQGESRYA